MRRLLQSQGVEVVHLGHDTARLHHPAEQSVVEKVAHLRLRPARGERVARRFHRIAVYAEQDDPRSICHARSPSRDDMPHPRMMPASLRAGHTSAYRRRARIAFLLPALCMALLAGCASTPPRVTDRAPGGLGGKVINLPPTAQRIVQIAEQEWTLWGRLAPGAVEPARDPGSPPALEHDPPFTTRVLLYWNSFSDPATALRRLRYPDGSLQPWSAVFVSFVMRAAGVPERAFPPSARHWDYIRHARMASPAAGVIALDATTTAPQPADLICAPRGDTAGRVTQFDQLLQPDSIGTYHCDIVVAVAGSVAQVIGGNVGNGVARLRIPLDARGRLIRSPDRPWLAVLRTTLP